MRFNAKPNSIGGVMDYSVLARKHMPADPAKLRDEVRRLSSTGLTAADIATALRLNLAAVREMLAGANDAG